MLFGFRSAPIPYPDRITHDFPMDKSTCTNNACKDCNHIFAPLNQNSWPQCSGRRSDSSLMEFLLQHLRHFSYICVLCLGNYLTWKTHWKLQVLVPSFLKLIVAQLLQCLIQLLVLNSPWLCSDDQAEDNWLRGVQFLQQKMHERSSSSLWNPQQSVSVMRVCSLRKRHQQQQL